MVYNLTKSIKNYQRLIIVMGCLISIYSYYFFLENKIYLIGSDAFYYLGIGDSIIQNGEMKNITSIPSQSVKTTQNGIAFLHAILSWIGLSPEGRIFTIVSMNYILYLISIYPLYKIARFCGLNDRLPLITLLSVYLGSWHIYRINLLAINDGIFNSLALWFIYITINLTKNLNSNELVYFSKTNIKNIVLISLLVVILIQFRLNAALIILSSVFSAIVIKNYKASLILISVCFLLVISFVSVYMFVEVVRLNNVVENYFFPMFKSFNLINIKHQLLKILPRLVAGLSRLDNILLALPFVIFPLSMIYYGIKGIIERNFAKVFISSICLSGLWFTMSFQNARVIWYIYPFVYLILISFSKLKLVGYSFVFLVFMQSINAFYSGFGRGPQSKFWLYVYENKISLPSYDSLLISANGRHPYFIFNKAVYDTTPDGNDGIIIPHELTWKLINDRNSLCVIGDLSYVNKVNYKINSMARKNGYKIEFNSLTPNLDKFKGWALVELKVVN